MKIQEENRINSMRLKGYSAATIAGILGKPASTIRSYIHRHPEIPNTKICQNCGEQMLQTNNNGKKKFCSDACRMQWWNTHQDDVNKQSFYTLTCKNCGEVFKSYGNKNRKYCCRACYVEARNK